MRAILLLAACLAAQAQTTPWVAGFVPQDGATGVPLNARLLIALNMPRNVKFPPVLLKNGTPVPGATEFLDYWVVFTPDAPLEPSTSYEFRITDFGPYPYQTFTEHFTTGSAADTAPLTLTATEPVDGQDAANYLKPLTLRFSKPLYPASVQNARLKMMDATSGYASELLVALQQDGVTLQTSGQYAFSLGHAYQISLPDTAIVDWTGGTLPQRAPIRFTTFAKPPKEGPSLVSSAPADGDSAVPTNSAIVLAFDRPLTPTLNGATFTLASGTEQVALEAKPLGERGVALVPAQLLSPNKQYTLSLSGLTDIYGAAAASGPIVSFQTGLLPDSTSLSLPVNYDRTVLPSNATPKFAFNRPVDEAALALSVVGLSQSYTPVPMHYQLSPDRRRLLVSPDQPLLPGVYTAMVQQIYDRLQHTSITLSVSFTITADARQDPSRVLAVSPPDATTDAPTTSLVEVVYDQQLDTAGMPAGAFQLTSSAGPVKGVLSSSTSYGRTQLTFRPSGGLLPSTAYQLSVTGLVDYAGNAAPAVSTRFSTAAVNPTESFRMLTATPANGAVVTDPLTPVRMTFNRALSPIGPTSSGYLAVTAGYIGAFAVPPGKVEVEGSTLTFTPAAPWPVGTYYINGSYLTDLSGAATMTLSAGFTVAPETPPAPAQTQVIRASPGDGGVVSSLGPLVIFAFSNPLIPNTVSANTIKAFGTSAGVSKTTLVSPTEVLVEFTAQAGSLVTLLVTSGVRDLYGNDVAPFSTTLRLSPALTTQSKVVRTRPARYSSSLTQTASLALLFDAPADQAAVEAGAQITANGVFVPGRFEWTPDARGVAFLPEQPFPAQANVQANWAGNQFSYQVEAALPAGGAAASLPDRGTVSPLDGVVDLRPQMALSDQDLAAASCTWMQGNATVEARCGVTQVRPGVLRLKPETLMLPQNLYVVKFSAGAVSWSRLVDTGAALADPSPVMIAGGPVAQAEGVPLNAIVSVAFTAPVSRLSMPGGIRLRTGGVELPMEYSWTDARSLRAWPRSFLRPGTEYTVTVSGFEDLAGHLIPDESWTFVTGQGIDTTPLDVLRFEPNGENSDPSSVISMLFSKQLAVDTVVTTAGVNASGISFSPDRRSFRIEQAGASPTRFYFYSSDAILDLAENALRDSLQKPSSSFGHPVVEGPPVLLARTPAEGLQAVPLNARFQLKFDRQVSLASAVISMVEEGVELPVQAKAELMGRIVTLTPARLPHAGARIEVRVEGVASADGAHVAEPAVWSFQMGSDIDLTAPAYRTFPVSGATVAADSDLRIRVNEHVNPVLVDAEHVVLFTKDGPPIACTLWMDDWDHTVVVKPQAPLSPNIAYYLSMNTLEDLAGHTLVFGGSGGEPMQFRAGDPGLAPTLAAVNPPDGSSRVAPNVTPQAYFDGPVDLTRGDDSMRLTLDGQPVAGSVTVSSGKFLTFTPSRALTPGRLYRLELTGLRGMNGEALPDSATSFTVQATGDYGSNPRVSSTDPANYAQNVPVTTPITLKFSAAVSAAWLPLAAPVVAGGYPVPGWWSVEGATATFQPAYGLPPLSQVTVGSYYSYSSFPGLGYQLTFATGSATSAPASTLESTWPTQGSAVPARSTRLYARFTRPVYTSSGRPPLQILAGTSDLSASFSVAEDGRTLSAEVTLPADRQITLGVSPDLKDLSGNPVQASPVTFRTLSSEESRLPGVLSITPANYTANVALTDPVVVGFTQPMDAASVPPALFVSDGVTLLSGNVESDETARQFRFTPSAPFRPGVRILVYVEPTAHDPNGWYISAFSSFFDTVSQSSPSTVTSYFATARSIDLKYSGPVSAEGASYTLRLGTTVIPVSVEQSGPDWLRLTPDSPLTAGTAYQLMAGGTPIAVTPAESTEGDPLRVESITPGDDGVLVRFNQAVNPVTLDRQRIRLLRPDGTAARFSIWVGTDQRSVRLVPEAGDESLDLELEGIESPGRGRLALQRRGGLPVRGGFRPARSGSR